MQLIAPSILSADFTRLGAEITDVIASGADWIHSVLPGTTFLICHKGRFV